MSGVTTGSRLQQLYALRARLDQEIAAERARVATAPRAPGTITRPPTLPDAKPPAQNHRRGETGPRPGLQASDRTTAQMLLDLGVTPRQVKEWAVDQGLLAAVVRGRVARHLVIAYATTHQTPATPTSTGDTTP